MLVVYKNKYIGLDDFEPWGPVAPITFEKLQELDKVDDFEALLEENNPEGIEEQDINDLLWYEWTWICEMLDINEDCID